MGISTPRRKEVKAQMARKSFRVDEHPGALGCIVGRIRIRRYVIRKDGQKEEKRLVYSQVYKILEGDKRKPIRKEIYGFVCGFQASDIYLNSRGVRLIDIDTVPDEEKDKVIKVLKSVLVGAINVSPG